MISRPIFSWSRGCFWGVWGVFFRKWEGGGRVRCAGCTAACSAASLSGAGTPASPVTARPRLFSTLIDNLLLKLTHRSRILRQQENPVTDTTHTLSISLRVWKTQGFIQQRMKYSSYDWPDLFRCFESKDTL